MVVAGWLALQLRRYFLIPRNSKKQLVIHWFTRL